ncbi:MAG: hypothetical protein R3E13_06170 [Alphaproteobacteria bacterium]
MKTADLIITALFGLFWLTFGLNNFFHVFPIPEPSQEGAAFMQALENTGYALLIVYGTQIITGLLLLVRLFVPLALLFLAPVIANILLYDLFSNPSGVVIGGVIAALYAFLLLRHRQVFMIFLKP